MPTATFLGDPLYPLCLGGNVFGWTADEATSHAILDRFAAAGRGMVDTADVYSAWAPGHVGGESERVIGSWLAARNDREAILVATKVAKLTERRGLAPDTIAAAARDSLARLRTDHIDLYYAHEPDSSVPLADTLGAFDQLVREGLIRAYGLSNYSASELGAACEVARAEHLVAPTAIQPRYNLVDRREYESGLAQVAHTEGLAVFPFYGLAAGFLTGKYTPDVAPSGARAEAASRYMDPARWAVVATLREIANELAVAPASVALAWLMAQPTITAPIASASDPSQMDALLAAPDLTLSADHLTRLTSVSADLPRTALD